MSPAFVAARVRRARRGSGPGARSAPRAVTLQRAAGTVVPRPLARRRRERARRPLAELIVRVVLEFRGVELPLEPVAQQRDGDFGSVTERTVEPREADELVAALRGQRAARVGAVQVRCGRIASKRVDRLRQLGPRVVRPQARQPTRPRLRVDERLDQQVRRSRVAPERTDRPAGRRGDAAEPAEQRSPAPSGPSSAMRGRSTAPGCPVASRNSPRRTARSRTPRRSRP